MQKLKNCVESRFFQNSILILIILNALLMGILTSPHLSDAVREALTLADTVCLAIFVAELVLKLIVYRLSFFKSGWNWFDLIIVLFSLFSEFSFLSVFRIFRILRVLRSLRALKSLRAFRLVSGLKHLRVIIDVGEKTAPT